MTLCSFRFPSTQSSRICGAAPFVTLNFPSFGCLSVASVRLMAGSNGMNSTCSYACIASFVVSLRAMFMMHVSIASWPSSRRFAARAERKISRFAVMPSSNMTGSSSWSWLSVSVPVLSEQRVCIPASSSIADSRATMAFFEARRDAPTAIVTVATTCMAIGIEAMRRTTAVPMLSRTSSVSVPLSTKSTMRMMTTRTEARAMRKVITLKRTFWNRPCWTTLPIIPAARPKKVFSPVFTTMASISPRLTVEPIFATSPFRMVTGRDSPVRAAWSTWSSRGPSSLQSAGTTPPIWSTTRSPGTSSLALTMRNSPLRFTFAFGASEAFRAAMAFPALCSSKKATVPLMNWRPIRTPKSGQCSDFPYKHCASVTAAASQIIIGIGPQK
mmetsp:Transcript_33175/g.80583  ORF Transcript_33175/g.80583 Transcript_33175/m.80583 type:complete len:385 (+) Transcript_33175:1844-2998(+)